MLHKLPSTVLPLDFMSDLQQHLCYLNPGHGRTSKDKQSRKRLQCFFVVSFFTCDPPGFEPRFPEVSD